MLTQKEKKEPTKGYGQRSISGRCGVEARKIARVTASTYMQMCKRKNARTRGRRNREKGHENETNLGSLGLPSGPMLFLANRFWVYMRRASSKSTFRLFMIFLTSSFPAASNPALASPSATFAAISNCDEEKPASRSLAKLAGRRW